ncbi:MAG TPA: ATP-binding protein [bacterium]|nr:ATP-binding protein [bacterium]
MRGDYRKRFLEETVFDPVFGRQMRFVIGPRQCGKTTMAREKLAEGKMPELYFNWDSAEVKRKYRREGSLIPKTRAAEKKWVCFDEIHKMPKWKNVLKGIFDTREDEYNFIVTGSARLDILRKAGDSLAGRYFVFRLSPFILAEMTQNRTEYLRPESNPLDFVHKNLPEKKGAQKHMESLIMHGGFPEPLFKGEERFSRMWNEEYFERIIREDMRDLSAVHYLEKAVDLAKILPGKVGAPLSVESLVRDLEINHRTVKRYLKHLGLNFLIFELCPYVNTVKARRLNKKMTKVYFYNYSVIQDEAARFENYIAVELKARVDLWNSGGAGKFDLYYIRNREKKETDFLITNNDRPYLLLEAKISGVPVESHHRYFSGALGGIPFVQLVKKKVDVREDAGRFFTAPASRFFG